MKKKHEPTTPANEAVPSDMADAAETPSAGADTADAEVELKRLRAREDELLRALAELQNVNRRRRQESETAVRYAAEPFVRELLIVLDDFERALRAAPPGDDPFRTGIQLVHDRLVKILEKEGVEPIRPQGEPFDPEIHDAIAHLPVPGAIPGTVVEVAVPGDRYRDRVLRHAKVVVAAEAVADPAGAEPRGGL